MREKIKIKSKIILFITLLFIGRVVVPLPVHAQSKSSLSISDAIYADLALQQALDNVSVEYHDEYSTDQVLLNTQRQWVPASTIKLYVAMYAYTLAARNQLDLNQSVQIDPKNVVTTELETDEFPALQVGTWTTINTLVEQMITQSDNTAYNTLLDILDRQEITRYVQSLGLTHTIIGSKLNLDDSQTQFEYTTPGFTINTTTADDYAKAFLLIQHSSTPQAKRIFMVLAHQKINNMLPMLLPKSLTVAHKTGDWPPLFHDGGIIEGNKQSYVLAIFTNLGDPNLIAHLSNIIYTKNYDLVGVKLNKSNNTNKKFPLDKLLSESTMPQVLGAKTDIHYQAPEITASDLGITAADLSLSLPKNALPSVIIPADSPMHFLTDTAAFIKEHIPTDQTNYNQIKFSTISQKLAEAKDLLERKKPQEANGILSTIEQQLESIAQTKASLDNSELQMQVKALSETRFSLLQSELADTKKEDRLTMIKEIAKQAKATMIHIEPFVPGANNALNPQQKPILGQVIKKTDNQALVQTATGVQITVTLPQTVKIKDDKTSLLTQPSSLQEGSTVALIGTTTGTTITPSFILTNVNHELIAPQPVTIVKVNAKDKTLVVSENGHPMQINITNQTDIKGKDTNIEIKAIQPGDVVVVHGSTIDIAQENTITKIPPTNTPTISFSPTTQMLSPTAKVTPSLLQKQTFSSTITIMPSIVPTGIQPTNVPTAKPTPHVVNATTIQVIQTTVDTKLPPVIIPAQPVIKAVTSAPLPTKITSTPVNPKSKSTSNSNTSQGEAPKAPTSLPISTTMPSPAKK